ncbi:MAG TPA: FHA domain-containing protein [Candidatus Acidoferrales bacterium]|nr:FHA domain-containing protein [Candidatus Acidoferrales bacterium]
MPRLLIQHAGQESRVFELTGDRPISIGRAKSSGLVLDDPSISRVHAVVRANPDGSWQIIDRDSANGVLVRGAKVKEAVLRAGDKIVLGDFSLRFEDSAERKVMTYGTAQLPPSFARALKDSAYSGSFMAVDSVANVAPSGNLREKTAEGRLKRMLTDVSRALASLQTVEKITDRSLQFVFEIEGAERGFAMLLDEETVARGDSTAGAFSFEPASIRYRGGVRPAGAESLPQFTISRSIIKQVMQDGLPLLISDAKSDPRVSASQSIALAGIQSAMCAPLGIGKKLRGLLYADNLSRRGMFTTDDLNVFTIIAVQTGIAVGRVRPRKETPETVRS